MKKHFNIQASFNCDSCSKCYKCVKSCPVQAIKIKNDDVFESNDLCIDCGNCFKICHKDVHINKFTPKELDDVLKNNKVIILLDSTFFMSSYDFRINQLEEALKKAGFAYVETAFDGLAVHDYLVDTTYEKTNEFYFNTNCIPFIKYLKKFNPQLTQKLLPYKTANEISAILKKEHYGNDYKLLLVTNCFGDFDFVDDSSCPIDYAILESELYEFLNYKNIKIKDFNATDKKRSEFKIQHFSTIAQGVVSGMLSCKNVIDYASKSEPNINSPLRFFICSGGCFNSKVLSDGKKPFEREQNYSRFLKENFIFNEIDLNEHVLFGDLDRFKKIYTKDTIKIPYYSEDAINTVLNGIGISKDIPEYDCNSCGYGSCKDFAIAILNDRANDKQCSAYINRLNLTHAKDMNKMIAELNAAFSLTIPDNRLERKLKTTPVYVGIYDNTTDFLEITNVIKEGLYIHIINCLKLAADLKDYNVFDLIGIDKNTLVQAILYHCNAKTQPILSTGDVVKYSDLFENKKEEASRSAIFAKRYYNVSDSVYHIIKYHKHDEVELPSEFPKSLLYVFRLFKIIDSISSVLTKSGEEINISFQFTGFVLYIYKTKKNITTNYTIDLYRQHDFKLFERFLKE